MSERLILWHRWLPPRVDNAELNAAVAAWQRSVATRFSVAGGTLIGALGTSVVAAFEPLEVVDALDIALDLLEEAEDAALEVAVGASVGEVELTDAGAFGAALERAQLLANRARAGDIVLDPKAREQAGGEFLFGRQVAAGPGIPRGITIDRRHPRRTECAEAIAELATPPLPPIIDSVRTEIENALADGSSRTFVVRGPVGAGAAELVSALERTVKPPRILQIGAAPGGIVPLASLRLALLRSIGSPRRVQRAFGASLSASAAVLAHVANGQLVDAGTLADALGAIARSDRGRSWVVLSPLSLVDGATLGALIEARARGADFVLFGRFPVESPMSRPLAELDEPVLDMTLPPLKTADARVVAEAVLGPSTSDEVARRVAVLGGDTVLGVVEAARTLIASGELVRENGAFVWRLGPRHGANAISTEALLGERLDLLDADSRRVLEAACVVPDGSSRDLLASVVELDGVREHAFARSLAMLSRDALLTGNEHPRPASSLLRWCILSLIPAARSRELHRFVGEVMRRYTRLSIPLKAELGYYLMEGGLDADARPLLTEAVEGVLKAGYERAARQVSAWMAQREEERLAREEHGTMPPPATPIGFEEEPPPSTEIFLDELLEEASAEQAAQLRAAPPPPKRAARPPPPVAPVQVDLAPVDIAASIADVLAGTATGDRSGQRALPSEFLAMLEAQSQRKATSDLDVELPLEDVLGEGDSESIDVEIEDEVPVPIKEAFVAFEDRGSAQHPRPTNGGARPPPPPQPKSAFAEDAIRAIRERDYAALEEAMQRAIVDGSDFGAVGRVRAVAELARGDLDGARRSLREARVKGKDDRAAQARYHLAEALLELHAGEPMRGIRAGLAALAESRRLTDPRGESAALHMLAACYRALGRDEQARRLETPPQ